MFSHSIGGRGLGRSFVFASIVAGSALAGLTSANAGQCPADKMKADVRVPDTKPGKGVTDTVLDQLMSTLVPLQRRTSAVADSVPREDAVDAVWVEPTLVGEVRFGDWTGEHRLRAASWRGLRPDRAVAELTADVSSG